MIPVGVSRLNRMTVSELIKRLQQFDGNEQVWIDVAGEYFYQPVGVSFWDTITDDEYGHGVVIE